MWRLNFLANQIESTFSIPIVRDTIAEDPEEFSLKIVIESPVDQRVTVGMPSVLTVRISGMYLCGALLIAMHSFIVYIPM